MTRIPRVRPGDPITADLYNAMAAALERSGTTFSGGHFVGTKDRYGQVVSLRRRQPMQIRLTAATGNAFAWEEVEDTAGGGVATFNSVRSGTTSDDPRPSSTATRRSRCRGSSGPGGRKASCYSRPAHAEGGPAMAKRFERQLKGKPILASTLNAPIAEIERLSKLLVASPIGMMSTAGGVCLYLAQAPSLWARITGAPDGSGGYPWLQQMEESGGGWSDGYLSTADGSPLAYNSIGSGAPTVPVDTIVRLTPAGGANDYRFSISTC